jgi:GDPmannose 4,6-dehydratase
VEAVFSRLGLNWEEYVTVDKGLITKNEKQGVLVGDFNKLNKRTGWEPKTGFSQMIHLMLEQHKNEN